MEELWAIKSPNPPPGNPPRRRTRSSRYGPRVCERSDGEHSNRNRFRLFILSGSSNRRINRKTWQRSPDKLSRFRWRNGTKGEADSLTTWGANLYNSASSWRRGLEERIEISWDRVGVVDDSRPAARSRVVRAVVRDPNKSHDEILHPN